MRLRKTKKAVRVTRYSGVKPSFRRDYVITEEPLELRLIAGKEKQTLAITMRTPGHDFELAVGFLFAEGIINSRTDIQNISYCLDKDVEQEQRYNIVNIYLSRKDLPPLNSLERHFFTTSACGVCGRASLEALELRGLKPLSQSLPINPQVLTSLPEKLRKSQALFEKTGGLHAAALFSLTGELIALREDVGRHNALDKLIGWAVLADKPALHDAILLVSGRASYELVQKALSARISLFCSVSAPSSLAVDLAKRFQMTLIGFLRGESFTVYTA